MEHLNFPFAVFLFYYVDARTYISQYVAKEMIVSGGFSFASLHWQALSRRIPTMSQVGICWESCISNMKMDCHADLIIIRYPQWMSWCEIKLDLNILRIQHPASGIMWSIRGCLWCYLRWVVSNLNPNIQTASF